MATGKNQNSKHKTQNYNTRSGFVILIVLVAVAIIMILYFLDISAIFAPTLKKKSGPTDSRPWLQDDSILSSEALIKLPKSPKPDLREAFTLTCDVTRDQSERGQVILSFTQLGEVSGSWRCRWRHDDRDYSIEANFAGNIDIRKIYADKNGEDKSKLYFITRGGYIKTTFKQGLEFTEPEEGIVYVTGWLCPDYSAAGLITITTDKTWSVTYTYHD